MNDTLIPKRPHIPKNTHKGQYGKILAVGGSADYYGAPILTALGAEYSGADLITLYLPKEHVAAAKSYSLNFFLKTFHDDCFTLKDVETVLKFETQCHVAVVGNGLGKSHATQVAIVQLLERLAIPVVLDAEALFPEVLQIKKSKTNWILTPHQKEFERVCGVPFSIENLKQKAKELECTFLVKGHVDYIAHQNEFYENHTGCVQMRVGGTGDVLAGIVASYRAQGLGNVEAARSAAYYYGKAGERLAQEQTSFSARSLAKFYPKSF